MATTQSPDTDSLFSSTPQLRAQLAQLQNTLSQQMSKPTFLLKPLGTALRLKTTQKKQVTTIQRNIHKQLYNSLTDTPTEQAILLSQSTSHTGAHLMQPSSEAYAAEDRCFRVAVARRLMLPHPAARNAADVDSPAPTKAQRAPLLWMSVWRCGSQACCSGQMHSRRDTFTQWYKVFIEQEVPALTRRERTAGACAYGSCLQPQRFCHVPRCCHCVSFFQHPGPHCSSQHPPRPHGQES